MPDTLQMEDIGCSNSRFVAHDFALKSWRRWMVLMVVILTPEAQLKVLFFLQEDKRWTLIRKQSFQKADFPTFNTLRIRGNQAARACDTEQDQITLLQDSGLYVRGMTVLQ